MRPTLLTDRQHFPGYHAGLPVHRLGGGVTAVKTAPTFSRPAFTTTPPYHNRSPHAAKLIIAAADTRLVYALVGSYHRMNFVEPRLDTDTATSEGA